MTDDAEVAAMLEQVVLIGPDDPPTLQEIALGEAVIRHLNAQDPVEDQPDVRPYLTLASTIELLDELRRRVLGGDGT